MFNIPRKTSRLHDLRHLKKHSVNGVRAAIMAGLKSCSRLEPAIAMSATHLPQVSCAVGRSSRPVQFSRSIRSSALSSLVPRTCPQILVSSIGALQPRLIHRLNVFIQLCLLIPPRAARGRTQQRRTIRNTHLDFRLRRICRVIQHGHVLRS